ncbi:beta-1,3-glucanase family protein [Streptomyces achromogenes]|uniref:beta-1,3-glucanase family protein n=1 Tax=Streptomyces achromogenes TaxID=67255 RepID=UPI0036CEAB25
MSPVHSPVGFGSPDALGTTAARLSAALNRGALLVPGGDNQPDGVPPSGYHQDPITHHYARLVHNHAGIGYASPYDDGGAELTSHGHCAHIITASTVDGAPRTHEPARHRLERGRLPSRHAAPSA